MLNLRNLQSLTDVDKSRVSIILNTNIVSTFDKYKISDIIVSLLRPIPSKVGGTTVRILTNPFKYYVHYIRDNGLNRISGRTLTVALHDTKEKECQFCNINKPTERYIVLCYVIDHRRYVLYSLSAVAMKILKREVVKTIKEDVNLKNWMFSFEKYFIKDNTTNPQDVRYQFKMIKHSVLDESKVKHADQLWSALNLEQNIYFVDEAEEAYQEMVASMIW